MKTEEFSYNLPKELIAQTPLEKRDDSRLLVLSRDSSGSPAFAHRRFHELPEMIRPGDCLVLNNSRVLPARLIGTREKSGGTAELLLLREHGNDCWQALAKPGKRIGRGDTLSFGDGALRAEVLEVRGGGIRLVRFLYDGVFLQCLSRLGQMPLPPYITKRLDDPERYQTVYSSQNGSAAAPTAGLHFTPQLLDTIRSGGARVCELTLHVGLGTFRPVQTENVEDHVMHDEVYVIPEETARAVRETKSAGGRVVAVGTTACRALESAADETGTLSRLAGSTKLFITPGYRFRVTDALITNFHLPESTLLMLVSALAGRDAILAAYAEAVRERYRFFSFGDAMLIV
ncbi:MAG: tRNA preQ1(34) S-adenosylmethionine ribosyltransferase-isomerase QueA [Oscillospiraceae bacterium]|jgi:S-adenosylmethionine:tRNA ribosyltransferase-isomerase|nr:tRNA preQ1(34) S-adenosylmethionine ribosyltransferase-isomerase QueA [Oscillospiraceae bacterium]